MVKLQYDSNGQYKLTLPKALMMAKGWGKGDNILLQLDSRGNITLVKKINEKKKKQ